MDDWGRLDMQLGTKIGIGIGATLAVGAGIAAVALARRDEDEAPNGNTGIVPPNVRSVAPEGGTSPGDDVLDYPGGGTSPGDEPIRMPVRGRIDPPGFWDDFSFDGSLSGDRLDATLDPRGWGNDIKVRGRVDGGGWSTEVDPSGWSNTTKVDGRRSGDGYSGTVDRPGLWNGVDHRIRETIEGVRVLREGHFDESWTPSWNEVSWRSAPNGMNIDGRTLEFDPPGWGNTTVVTLEANVPAGVEATIAAALYDGWKTEQERQDDYPDPDPYPVDPSPGDDPGYPTSPGDDGGYPTGPGDYPDYPYA